jgi:hypothetical protein
MNEVEIAVLDLNLPENIVELMINDFEEFLVRNQYILSTLLLRC